MQNEPDLQLIEVEQSKTNSQRIQELLNKMDLIIDKIKEKKFKEIK